MSEYQHILALVVQMLDSTIHLALVVQTLDSTIQGIKIQKPTPLSTGQRFIQCDSVIQLLNNWSLINHYSASKYLGN